jgi:hypothetical protein
MITIIRVSGLCSFALIISFQPASHPYNGTTSPLPLSAYTGLDAVVEVAAIRAEMAVAAMISNLLVCIIGDSRFFPFIIDGMEIPANVR